MELIHDLETERRGVYSGAIGFFDFKGNINSCIAIRTMVIKDDIVQFQSGAGIVYDSIPEDEYKETINKAKALVKAIELAENGFSNMIVIIDNYDSFTYNLVQHVGVIDTNLEFLKVFRNDEITIKSLTSKQISHIIISPGPGWPDDAGKTMDIIKCFNNSTPILGICLGHQAIVRAFNGDIVKCNEDYSRENICYYF